MKYFLPIWLNLKCGKEKILQYLQINVNFFIFRQLLEAVSKVLVFAKTPLWMASCAFNPHDWAPENRPFIAMLGSWTVSLTEVDKGSRSQTVLNLFVSFSSQKKPNVSYHLGAWDLSVPELMFRTVTVSWKIRDRCKDDGQRTSWDSEKSVAKRCLLVLAHMLSPHFKHLHTPAFLVVLEFQEITSPPRNWFHVLVASCSKSPTLRNR